MKYYNIRLVGYPDFFNDFKSKDTFLNWNQKFWDYIFLSERSKKMIQFGDLTSQEKSDLKYIIANLEVAYKILFLFKHKSLGIASFIFAFNIINSYLKITERFYGGVVVKFYDYFKIKEEAYKNIENNILYKFFIDECGEFINSLEEGDCLHINLYFSEQLFQIYLLKHILKSKGYKQISFKVNTQTLVWFENKKSIERKLLTNFDNIVIDRSLNVGGGRDIYFEGNKYSKTLFIDASCSWNKCSFCNIGKNEKSFANKEEKVMELIDYIKENKVFLLQISDPSTTLEDIILLSEKIIEHDLKVKIKIFARFSDGYTDDVLALLGKAGLKFLGIGLESASTRLNNLMQKYDKDYSKNDFGDLVGKAKGYGIQVHYYTIFGFPTETKEEILETKSFLLDQLNKHSFFSYTAGYFGLNKGTDVYYNAEEYGVEFEEEKIGGETFIKKFSEKNIDENKNLIKNTIDELIKNLFFPENTRIDFKNFWYFIEHSNIFHIQKMVYDYNPYKKFFSQEITEDIVQQNFKFKRSNYLQFFDTSCSVQNWITMNYHVFDKETYGFIKENPCSDISSLLKIFDKSFLEQSYIYYI